MPLVKSFNHLNISDDTKFIALEDPILCTLDVYNWRSFIYGLEATAYRCGWTHQPPRDAYPNPSLPRELHMSEKEELKCFDLIFSTAGDYRFLLDEVKVGNARDA